MPPIKDQLIAAMPACVATAAHTAVLLPESLAPPVPRSRHRCVRSSLPAQGWKAQSPYPSFGGIVSGSARTDMPLAMDGMELLTDAERVHVVAALGLLAFKTSQLDPGLIALLLKLSSPDTQVWVQPADPVITPRR